MTILAVAYEEGHVVKEDNGPSMMRTTTLTVNGTNVYDSTLSRDALMSRHARVGGPTFYLPFTAQSEFWLHFSMHSGFAVTSGTDNSFLFFRSAANSNNKQFRLLVTAASADSPFTAQAQVTANNGTSWTNVGAPFSMGGSLDVYDIHIKFHASAGLLEVYKNDVSVVSFSGALVSTNNVVDNIFFTSENTDDRVFKYWSQIIVTDSAESTLGTRLCTLAPTASGAQSDWTGAFSDVNDTALDVSTLLTTDTANNIQVFTTGDIPTAYTRWYPLALISTISGTVSADATVNDMQHLVRIGTTNYTSASAGFSKNNVRQFKWNAWLTSPATGLAFSASEINGAQLGVKAV